MKIKKFILGKLGTNCYILVSNKANAVVIDPGDEVEKIVSFIESNKLRLKYIMITHGHFDHIMALDGLNNKYPEAVIGISKKDVEVALNIDKQLEFIGMDASIQENNNGNKKDIFNIYLKDKEKIVLDDIDIEVLETPGHTEGGVCFFVNSKYLFSGDTLFRGNVGRTDFPMGNSKDLKFSLKKLLLLPEETILYSGHGENSILKNEKNWLKKRFI